MRLATLACALAVAAASPVLAAPPAAPSYEVTAEGRLVLSGLPDVLSRPEVRPHLTTGLTTSFVLQVTASRQGAAKQRGGARIDVRWEPWDEVFLAAVMTADGQVRRETVGSFERLVAWWRSLVVPLALGVPGGAWRVDLDLGVVPFSQSEERDAQRWFAGALQDRGPAQAPSGGASRLDDVVDLLMATSIQRQSIVRYQWQGLPVTRHPSRP